MARPALAATRAVSVLNFLAAHPSEEFTLSDLAGRLDINLASAHAVLRVLTDSGYLVRHDRLRTYSLGPTLVALGTGALQRHPAIPHAQDEAGRLHRELGLGVSVTTLAGDDMLYLWLVGEHGPHDVGVSVGQRVPMVPPVGAVFAAWDDPQSWLARANDRPQMETLLAEVRARGWAMAFAERARGAYRGAGALVPEVSYDVVMIAAPVFGPAGDAVVAISLIGFGRHLTADEVMGYGRQVRDAALAATARSGGREPGQ